MAVLLILISRPLAGLMSLSGSRLALPDRWVVAVYGVHGIGSIFCLAYASSLTELDNLSDLWVITALTIFLSTLLLGLSVGWSMERNGRSISGPSSRN